MPREHHKRCLRCGYILDGLPEQRCPECGRPFDPARPETYHVAGKAHTGALHLLLALLAPAVLMVPWCLAGSLGGDTVGFLIVLSVALELYVGARSIRELLKPRWVQPRWCWWLALLISLIMVLGHGLLLPV